MILTRKCKDDFTSFRLEKYGNVEFIDLPNILQNALIIEFFDSVGITIIINNQNLQTWFFYEIKTFEVIKSIELVRTRQEATERAIKKANDIYNSRQ